MKAEPRYLGGGVYASVQPKSGYVVLTTGHHDPKLADNTIYLDNEVRRALAEFMVEVLTGKKASIGRGQDA